MRASTLAFHIPVIATRPILPVRPVLTLSVELSGVASLLFFPPLCLVFISCYGSMLYLNHCCYSP